MPGTGAVVRIDGQRCAVFRDDDAVLHGPANRPLERRDAGA